MNTELEEKLKEEMKFTTLIVSCKECVYWREVNTKKEYLSICTYNSIGEMKINSLGRCERFTRKD